MKNKTLASGNISQDLGITCYKMSVDEKFKIINKKNRDKQISMQIK